MIANEILHNYSGWLHHAASGFGDQNLHDDLVNEGRIAAWRQMEKHGQEHAGFMTSQARLRMGQIARGEKAFGGVKVPVRDVKPVANVEQFDVDISPAQADIADAAMWAYHSGEIYAAIERLSPGQRAAVRVFLADGIMTHPQRASWADARMRLAEDLRNLEGLVRVQGPTTTKESGCL